jgi:putative heme-binding domain-containing protein
MSLRPGKTAAAEYGTNRWISVVYLFCLAVATTVCTAMFLAAQKNPNSNDSSNAASDEGRQIFAASCSGCHGLDGRGGERAPDIAAKREIQKLSDAVLLRIIREGVPGTGMPAFRTLGNSRIQAVVRHLRNLQGQGATTVVTGSSEAGKALFFGKAACSDCHMVNGVGGPIGSDLSNYGGRQSAQQIREVLINPNRNLDECTKTVVATTLDGHVFTGVARNEDNFSLQLQTLDGVFHFLEKSNLGSVEHRPESLMPSDYASRLQRQELDDIVSYLTSLGRQGQSKTPGKRSGKHLTSHSPD